MDPNTGELWNEKKLAELRETSATMADELEQRLVQVEGSEDALAELAANVALGAQAKRQAREVSELEQLARDRARQEWKRLR